jgi:hypothetical protein
VPEAHRGANMSASQKIVQLRELLAEKFPNARAFFQGRSPARSIWPTGISQLDQLLNGGLPKGAITEIVAENSASGSALVMLALLQQAHENNQWLALVDAQDSFDPAPLDNALLSRLLWLRCRTIADATRATDLLLRDDNLRLTILDLRLSPPAQLRKIPGSTWFRLQRLIEHNGSSLLVLTPSANVGCAQNRLALQTRFTLDALTQTHEELFAKLEFQLLRAHDAEIGGQEIIAHAS